MDYASGGNNDQALVQAYSNLLARNVMNHDILYRTIAFVLTTEAALFVGLVQLKHQPALQLIIGIAIGILGVMGPMIVRFVENVILMDRVLLDRYEQDLAIPEPLRQRHSSPMPKRRVEFSEQMGSEAVARLEKRTIKGFRGASAIERALDLMGQPSLAWTALIALGGVVGFAVGVSDELSDLLWVVVIGVFGFLLTAMPWAMANGWFQAVVALVSKRKQREP